MTVFLMLDAAADTVARRREFRKVIDGKNSAALIRYFKDSDPQIRKTALFYYFSQVPEQADKYLLEALDDKEAQVRLSALKLLKNQVSKPEIQARIDKLAGSDPDQGVRQLAGVYSWPFYRDNKLLKDDPNYDYEIITVKSIQLPGDKWKFTIDPKNQGHRQKYFEDKFDDGSWKNIKVGHWEEQGFPDYDGIGWYRIRFQMPEKIDSNAVELLFQAVDESAWVWLNGQYIGQHDIGAAGWDHPFRLDVTREIKWGGENILTVRVLDRMNAGGIWKPITLDILK